MLNDKIIKVEITDYFLHDKLHALAVQYATTTDHLINAAIKRLIDDIEFVRELRTPNANITLRQDE